MSDQTKNAGAMAADARDRAGAFYDDNPLAAGAIALYWRGDAEDRLVVQTALEGIREVAGEFESEDAAI